MQYSAAGDPKKALEILRASCARSRAPGAKGYQFNSNRAIAAILIQMGDVAQARHICAATCRDPGGADQRLPGWRASYHSYGQNWEAEIELDRAMIFEARGQFREAEAAYGLPSSANARRIKSFWIEQNPPRNPACC